MTIRISSLSLRYIKVDKENRQEVSMIKITVIKEIISIDIGHKVEIEEHHTEVEVSMDKAIEGGCIMSITTEMTLDETILEKHEITENKIIEVDTEGIIEMIILEEVEVGLGTDNAQIILGGMIKVVVGLDQVQELAPIERELDDTSVGNMTVQLCK